MISIARYVNPKASQKKLVNVGRLSTILLMAISAGLALLLTNALQLFNIILMFGAGTGLIFLLRWFWWRINAWSEIAAMVSSGIISILFNFTALGSFFFGIEDQAGRFTEGILSSWSTYPMVILITSTIWLAVTFLTEPEKKSILMNFYKRTVPGRPGSKRIVHYANSRGKNIQDPNKDWNVPSGILATLTGCIVIYGSLLGTGYWMYGRYTEAIIATVLVFGSTLLLIRFWNKIKSNIF